LRERLARVTTSNLPRRILPHFNLLIQIVIALTQVQGCSGATTQSFLPGMLSLSQFQNRRFRQFGRELQTGRADLPPREPKMVESQWRALFRAAILELDPKQLEVRVKSAEDAITARASAGARITREERRSMDDALSVLRALKRKQS
jgi:hypothetical protein